MLANTSAWAQSAAIISVALMAGTAQADLLERDLDGDTVIDAFYDSDLDITWLRNANVIGPVAWETASEWAGGLTFGGYSDWRLPASAPCGSSYGCTDSEMGHLWYTELGNVAGGPLTNSGGFQGLQASWYWSGQVSAGAAVAFLMADGRQANQITGTANSLYAVAVRDGDVPAIPEPSTYALLAAGVLLTGLYARRQRFGAT